MSSHPMAKAIRESYGAAFRGDPEPLRRLYLTDVVMHFSGKTPLSGDVRGLGEFRQWAKRFFERAGRTYGEEVISVVADDDWAFMLTVYHAERDGRRVEDRAVEVYRLRDGRVVETWSFVGDPDVQQQVFG